jgi:DNA-binding NarL/FixJ family response regulator
MIIANPVIAGEKSLIPEDIVNSWIPLRSFKRLFIDGEAKFLLACLAKGFNPSFIVVGQSNLEVALAFKSIRRTTDLLGAATSTSQAIGLLRNVKPGFIFIHERTGEPQFADLLKYVSQLPSFTKIFVLADSLGLVGKYDTNDVDVFIADRDLFLPVNPLAQGCMAMIAGTSYRSPSVTRYISELSLPVEQISSRHISLSLRDQQLLEAYVLGLSNREVAESLGLSVRTVQTYSGQLLARLGVNNRQKALLRIAQLGISVIPKFFNSKPR